MHHSTVKNLLRLQDLADELEKFVDTHGMAKVAEALALMASAKSDHVTQYTDSDSHMTAWEAIATACLKLEYQARELGLDQ